MLVSSILISYITTSCNEPQETFVSRFSFRIKLNTHGLLWRSDHYSSLLAIINRHFIQRSRCRLNLNNLKQKQNRDHDKSLTFPDAIFFSRPFNHLIWRTPLGCITSELLHLITSHLAQLSEAQLSVSTQCNYHMKNVKIIHCGFDGSCGEYSLISKNPLFNYRKFWNNWNRTLTFFVLTLQIRPRQNLNYVATD